MNEKICSECGTENESEYIYCKNCGAPLTAPKAEVNETESTEFIANEQTVANETENRSTYEAPVYNAAPDVNNSENGGAQYSGNQGGYGSAGFGYGAYAIDGIPAEDVNFFVGKKSAEICPKFMKMEFARSKTSWCWPAAILGFIFGPLGSALWFFYRKMYKIALILLAVGTLLTVTTSVLTYDTQAASFENIFDAIVEGDTDALLNAFEDIGSEGGIKTAIASGLDEISRLATCILTGIFGFYAYKEFCVKKIREFRMGGIDPRYYRIGLASIGGVSGGMLAVGIISMIMIENIASAVTMIISII